MRNITHKFLKIFGTIALLVLTNEAVFSSCKPELELNTRIVSVEFVEKSDSKTSYEIKLQADITNIGKTTVFISNRTPWLSFTKVSASKVGLTDRTLYSFLALPSNSLSKKWEEFRGEVDKDIPPRNHFDYLKPGDSRTLDLETIVILENVDIENLQNLGELWFQIEILLWYPNIEPVESRDERLFGKSLQKRWKKQGCLRLDALASKPIRMDLN